MLFNSYGFILIFLPLFVILFYVVRNAANKDQKYRDVCKWIIIVASLIFYAPFEIRNLLVLAASVVVNAVLALMSFLCFSLSFRECFSRWQSASIPSIRFPMLLTCIRAK